MTTKGSQLHMTAGATGGGKEGVGVGKGCPHVSCVWAVVLGRLFKHYKHFYAANANEDAPLVGHDFLSLTIGLRPRHRQSRRCCCRCRWPRPAFADGQLRWPSSWPWRDHATPCQAWTGFSSLPLLVADDDHVGDGAGAGTGNGYDATWLIGQLRQRRRIFLRLLWHTTICGKFSWETFSSPPPYPTLSRSLSQFSLSWPAHSTGQSIRYSSQHESAKDVFTSAWYTYAN